MHNTEISTYFTSRIGTSELLYSAEDWVEITLRLETAGPVAVSTRQEIVPLLSGKGVLLPVDDDFTFILPRGNRLYIAASAVNRVNFCVKPYPYINQALNVLSQGFASVVGALRGQPLKPQVYGDSGYRAPFAIRGKR